MEPSDLDRILTQQRELHEQLQALQARLEGRFDAVGRHLDRLMQRVSINMARSQVHEEILQQLAASIARIDQYAARQDALTAEHAARLTRQEMLLEALAAEHFEHAERLARQDEILARIDENSRRIAEILAHFEQGRNGR